MADRGEWILRFHVTERTKNKGTQRFNVDKVRRKIKKQNTTTRLCRKLYSVSALLSTCLHLKSETESCLVR